MAQDEKGEKVALKIIPLDMEEDESIAMKNFYEELVALAELDHPNIWKLKKYSEFTQIKTLDDESINVSYIAMEYAEEGELFKCWMNSEKFDENEARYYFNQLINTLEYMHSMGYYHRDIKPENLLLDSNFNLKIADFGFATKNKVWAKRRGTINYMTPEMIENRIYNCEHSDLFAAAVTLSNLVTKRAPFAQAETNDKYYKHIMKKDYDHYWRARGEDTLSEEFKDLFLKMVSYDPSSRLTIKEIKEHKWFKVPLMTQEEMFMKMWIRMKKRRVQSFKVSKPTTSKSKRSLSTRLPNSNKKYSNIYYDKTGDEIIHTIIEALKIKGYYYCKSRFRILN